MSSSTPEPLPPAAGRLPIVVVISGQGTNLSAIAAAAQRGLPVEIRAVISDRAAAPGLARARELGLPTETVSPADHPDRTAHDAALADRIEAYAPRAVVLAGYMRILTPPFVARFAGRLLNIHPSLLPKYPGLHTHRKALAAGDTEHGATVHYVTDELDGGPRVALCRVRVRPDDTESMLSARVQAGEHRLYPTVLGWLAAGRLVWREGGPWFDGAPIAQPLTVEVEDVASGA